MLTIFSFYDFLAKSFLEQFLIFSKYSQFFAIYFCRKESNFCERMKRGESVDMKLKKYKGKYEELERKMDQKADKIIKRKLEYLHIEGRMKVKTRKDIVIAI